MKKLITTFIVIISTSGLHAQETRQNLERHVYTLTADSMLGRRAGSDQSAMAARYITDRFQEIGLEPAVRCENGFQYSDTFYTQGIICTNILGVLYGTDPELKDEYIVIGAHYDHLGFKAHRADTVIYHGADDNASGVAMMLELARNLKLHEGELKRSVIFAAFDGEELGLYGSAAMARKYGKELVKFMVSLDMVGWYKHGALEIREVATLEGGVDIINSVTPPDGLNIKLRKYSTRNFSGSDHDAFQYIGVPAFHISTGKKSPYHKPADTADKIDYDGMELITGYLTPLLLTINRQDTLKAANNSRLM